MNQWIAELMLLVFVCFIAYAICRAVNKEMFAQMVLGIGFMMALLLTIQHVAPIIVRLFDKVDRFQTTVNKLNGAWDWPLFGKVTQEFGENHHGIDIAANEGIPVRSIGKGIVKIIADDPTYGLVVVIDHGSGLETVYAHNSKLLVKEGYPVLEGTKISETGNTGNSTGPHLHFEVRKDGVNVDPREFLK